MSERSHVQSQQPPYLVLPRDEEPWQYPHFKPKRHSCEGECYSIKSISKHSTISLTFLLK